LPNPARVGSQHGGGDSGLDGHCCSIETTGGVHRPLLLTSIRVPFVGPITFGRKRKLDREMVRVAAERYAKGETMAELAEVYGVSEPTIWRALQPEIQEAA
jgi:hypothetical protein